MSDLNGFLPGEDRSSRIDNFLYDLSSLLAKHFGNDWQWRYDSDQTLQISSGAMADMWDGRSIDWEGGRYEK